MDHLPEIASLLHSSQLVVITRERDFLVAAALHACHAKFERTFNSDNLGIRIQLLHSVGERMNRIAEKAAAEAGFFQTMKDLITANKVLELSHGFAPKTFLEPPTSRLAHFELRAACHVRLEGGRAAVHCILLHYDDDWCQRVLSIWSSEAAWYLAWVG
jgi:hypothetical protein